MTSRVLITTSQFGVVDETPIRLMEEAGYSVTLNPFGHRLTREEAMDLLADEAVVGLVAGLEPLDREVLTGCHLKVISRVGSGIANVDLVAAEELGIAVRSTPDGPTAAVAELVLGGLLALLREIPALNTDLHAGRWKKRTGGQVAGRTVLIVGFGRIGARVAELVAAFGGEVLVHDPYVDSSQVPFQTVTREEGYARADVISFHNSGEDCLLGDADLEQLRPGVLLLNASRGTVVSESAILQGLDSGIVGGAWLDVFADEPYEGQLIGRPEVILTPHIGSYTRECRLSMERDAVDNLLEVLGGRAPK